MQVLTMVDGKVKPEKQAEFEQAYKDLEKTEMPGGLVVSYMAKNGERPDEYRIIGIWDSMESLEQMRANTPVPKAIALFQNIGSKAKMQAFELRHMMKPK